MKYILGIGVAVLVVAGGWLFFWDVGEPAPSAPTSQGVENSTIASEDADDGAREGSQVTLGRYVVVPEESVVRWAGKKPLIEGYINSGTLALEGGEIVVGDDEASGSFTIDMETLQVSETRAKPGQESTLASHLKGERWFDIETYPTATFSITEVSTRPDSGETLTYDVRGTLTMKGATGELTFPATIRLDNSGRLVAEASLEFDRTKWGITAGSGSFFDNLADNVIDDMVALSFTLVAVPSEE